MALPSRFLTIVARLAAGLGLQSAAAPALFTEQLWLADHVVAARVVREGTRVLVLPRKVYKGDPGGLRMEGSRLAVAGELPAGATKEMLFLLRRQPAGAVGHSIVAAYSLDNRQRFGDAAWQLGLSDLEQILHQAPFDTRTCDVVTRRGDFLLCTELLHKGTRSQGRRGRLFHSGVEVRGERKGQTVGGAQFIYAGEERPHLWSVSGWDLSVR